jgi:hypothetical protein
MYCIITDSKGKSRIENTLYWKKGSYKMNCINSLLSENNKTITIEYYDYSNNILDKIILGKKQ